MKKSDIAHLIKNVSKYIYYGFNDFIFNSLSFFNGAKNEPIANNILIIISDGLGDNIVRIELLKKYVEFFNSQNLTFLIEETSGVNELLDLVVDKRLNYIYFSSRKWLKNPLYRFKKINDLYKFHFSEIVILFTIANRISMPFINSYNTLKTYYYHTDDISRYSLLDDIFLYNQVTGNNIGIEEVAVNLKKVVHNFQVSALNIPNEYIVIGIGASLYGRRYPVDNLRTVIEWLISNNYKIVFLGKGDTDMKYVRKLMKLSFIIQSSSINLINKLSFKESLHVLNATKLFLGVESGLFNAANFLNIPFVVIYGGGHYGRFKHNRENSVYVSNKMPCFACNWSNCPHGSLKHKSAKCVSTITPKSVITSIKSLLN